MRINAEQRITIPMPDQLTVTSGTVRFKKFSQPSGSARMIAVLSLEPAKIGRVTPAISSSTKILTAQTRIFCLRFMADSEQAVHSNLETVACENWLVLQCRSPSDILDSAAGESHSPARHCSRPQSKKQTPPMSNLAPRGRFSAARSSIHWCELVPGF